MSEENIPFYKTVKTRFQDVKTEPEIDAAQFCEACDAVIGFFDLFTNAPFAIVRADLASKIAKLRQRLAVEPGCTLEGMLEQERVREQTKAPDAITGAMTWLLRSLRFTSMGLRRNMSREEEEVSVSMTWAYGESLKPYHGWAVRPIFQLAMKAVPYRANFYRVLGEPTDIVMAELDAWLGGLEKVLEQMDTVYKEGRYGSIDGRP